MRNSLIKVCDRCGIRTHLVWFPFCFLCQIKPEDFAEGITNEENS